LSSHIITLVHHISNFTVFTLLFTVHYFIFTAHAFFYWGNYTLQYLLPKYSTYTQYKYFLITLVFTVHDYYKFISTFYCTYISFYCILIIMTYLQLTVFFSDRVFTATFY
jgi:hypothetical protein